MLAFAFLFLMGAPEPVAGLPTAAPAIEATTDSRRVIGLRGASNFRDLGGYRTEDGRHVRWNMVYRSNKLSALTPADEARVDALRLGAVIDLRTVAERSAEPDKWLHRPAFVYESDKADVAPMMHDIMSQGTDAAALRQGFAHFYARMPDLYRSEYATLFKHLATGDEPMLMHCTAGKDRTGVASALLLTALGVPRATVIADYALTSQLLAPLPATAGAAGMTGAAAAVLYRADPLYITTALDSMSREYGSIDNYMRTGLGMTDMDIARLRHRLIE